MRRTLKHKSHHPDVEDDWLDDSGAEQHDRADDKWAIPDDWASERVDNRKRDRKRRTIALTAIPLAVLLCVLCAGNWLWVECSQGKAQLQSSAQIEHRINPIPAASMSPIPEADSTNEIKPNKEPLTDSTFYYFRSQLRTDEVKLYDTICVKLAEGDERVEHLYAQNADQILRVMYCVLNDHPEFYWLEKSGVHVSWNDHGNSIEGSLELKPILAASQRELVSKRLETISAQLKRKFGALSDYEKARGVYEYIIDNAAYDDKYGAQSLSDIVLYGKGVCAGYASLTQYLILQLGIPAIYVTGTGKNENHAWNIIQLDGEWYQIDTTWGDPVGQNIGDSYQGKNFRYFCLTDDEMYLDHTPDSTYSYPRCTATACNYFIHEGRYTDRYDEKWLISLLRREQGNPVVFRAASRQVFEEYKSLIISQKLFSLLEPVFGHVNGCSYSDDEHLLILFLSLE